MNDFSKWLTRLAYRCSASPRFFVATVLLLVLQSVWMAFTAVYPLPFDEFVHVGTIQIYAKQWLPFITEQPAEASFYGDITRTPDYLYHYLMSFPYRLFDIFTDSEMALVVATRLINVIFVVGGVILFRKLLLEWGVPRRLVHVVLLAFVVTPIIPFLAAHVNYDNLMFLLSPIFLLLGTRLIKSNDNLPTLVLSFAFVGFVTVLVKQSFLPVAAATFVYVAFTIWRRNKGELFAVVNETWQRTGKGLSFAALCLGLLLVVGLFAERYGGNFVRYRAVRVQCQAIQPREVCEDFGPWYRDNVTNIQNRPAEPPYGNPVSFSQYWLTRIMRGYYANFAHTPTQGASEREPHGPIAAKSLLPLPISFGYLALGVGSVAVVLQRRRLWAHQYFRFGLLVAVSQLAVLWIINYQSYLSLWKAEAIQARYTYPVLIIMFAIMAQAVSWSVAGRKWKAGLFVAFLLLYVWGGGITGWLIRADDTWRWQNPVVQNVNRPVQKILRHLVLH